jgi:hypothetical protein
MQGWERVKLFQNGGMQAMTRLENLFQIDNLIDNFKDLVDIYFALELKKMDIN